MAASSANGDSRLGGLPTVDSDFDWPVDPGGDPLPFVGQVDCGDIRQVCGESLLPEDGVLILFYDIRQQPSGYQPSHRGRWAIRYSRSRNTLAKPPEGMANDGIRQLQLTAVGDLTLPESDSAEIAELRLSPDEADRYESLLDELKGIHGTGVRRKIHRILGWPDAIQHDPAILAQLASSGLDAGEPSTYQLESATALLDNRKSWRLIAQIDSEESAGVLWGLYGRIYFMMKEPDVRRRSWDAAWVVLQWS